MGKLFGTFAHNMLKGLLGVGAAALLYLATNFHPEGSTFVVWAWNAVIVGALTGLAGVLSRLARGNPPS